MGEVRRRMEAMRTENALLRSWHIAVVKQYGRVRLPVALIGSIDPGDDVTVRQLGDEVVFTYEPSNMVIPGGVKNGEGNAVREQSAG